MKSELQGSEPRRTAGRWLGRGMLVLLSFCVIFVLFEVGLIIAEPLLGTGQWEYDRDLGFRVRPGAMGSNQFGFNDRDYPARPAAGTYRILLLGDSFNWGSPNHTRVLERLLTRHFPARSIEVINAGYPMTHTAEQLRLLEKVGLGLNPDLVILGFFAGNDFLDGDPHRKRIVVNDTYVDIDRRSERLLFGRYPLVPSSRALHWIRQRWRILREERITPPVGSFGFSEGRGIPDILIGDPRFLEVGTVEDPLPLLGEMARLIPKLEVVPTFSKATFLQIEAARLDFCLSPPARWIDDPRVEYILSSLREMKALLDANGIDFQVGIYPDEYQVVPRLARVIAKAMGREIHASERTCQQRILGEFLGRLGVPFVDFLPILQDANRVRGTYLPRNTHWNEWGHVVVGYRYFADLAPRFGLAPKALQGRASVESEFELAVQLGGREFEGTLERARARRFDRDPGESR